MYLYFVQNTTVLCVIYIKTAKVNTETYKVVSLSLSSVGIASKLTTIIPTDVVACPHTRPVDDFFPACNTRVLTSLRLSKKYTTWP